MRQKRGTENRKDNVKKINGFISTPKLKEAKDMPNKKKNFSSRGIRGLVTYFYAA
jgi:hypothetical protein